MKLKLYINDKYKGRPSKTLKEFDMVMAIIGDTIGKTNLVMKKHEGSYCSNNTGRFRLKPSFKKDFQPYFLEILFQSTFIQLQVQKAKAQTGQPKISDNEINKFLIPIISKKIQQKIQQKITKSFNLRKQSKHLLECAKRAVEMAIEKNENKAIKWLQKQTEVPGNGAS